MLFYGNDFYWIFFRISRYIGFTIVPVINKDRTSNKTADDTLKNKNDKLSKVFKRKTSLISKTKPHTSLNKKQDLINKDNIRHRKKEYKDLSD